MESGKRMSAKPRPCCRRWVQAKKRPRAEASANTVRKLQRREISWKREPAFNMRSSGERFLHFQLQVRDSRLTEVSRTEFITPSAFIFLYENQLFLTFRNRTLAVWNFRGELITSFEDHSLWHPDCNTNNIYITSDQDLIISYCKANSDDSPEGNAGSINISNIFTGRSVAKIQSSNLGKSTGSSRLQCTETEALSDITAIYFDEDRSEIYSGKAVGLVHVWSN